MKLGIVVVYFVSKENIKLMHIHLERIAAHTTVPYTIYGLINSNPKRTLPKVLKKLERTPNLQIVKRLRPDLSMFGESAALPVIEHAYYLDQLVRVAFQDGCSHIATLHVDSFPVKDRWDQILIDSLKRRCHLTAIQRIEDKDAKPHPSGMLFTANFYRKYRPTFRLQAADYSSPDFKKYVEENDGLIIRDSGVGYGFRMWECGLEWIPLKRSNKNEDHHLFGGIYGDCLFHVGGAVRDIRKPEYIEAGEGVWRELCFDHVKYINHLRGV